MVHIEIFSREPCGARPIIVKKSQSNQFRATPSMILSLKILEASKEYNATLFRVIILRLISKFFADSRFIERLV